MNNLYNVVKLLKQHYTKSNTNILLTMIFQNIKHIV